MPQSGKKMGVKQNIQNIYLNQFFEISLWAWCTALKIESGFNQMDSVRSFIDFMGLDPDDAPLYSLQHSLIRRSKEFRTMMREEGRKIAFFEPEIDPVLKEFKEAIPTLKNPRLTDEQKMNYVTSIISKIDG